MRKLRGFLLGLALALPLAAVGASGDLPSPYTVESAPLSQDDGYRCCWVFYFGTWWCIAC